MNTEKELTSEVEELTNDFDAVYERQKTKREAFMNATQNAELVRETKLALDVAGMLYRLRKQSKVTQKELAKRMRTNQATIAKIEKGRDLRISTIDRFAAALGKRVTVDVTGV